MLGICLKLGLFAVSPFIKDMQLNVRKSTLWKEFQISWNSHQAGKNIKQILVQISSLLFSQLITYCQMRFAASCWEERDRSGGGSWTEMGECWQRLAAPKRAFCCILSSQWEAPCYYRSPLSLFSKTKNKTKTKTKTKPKDKGIGKDKRQRLMHSFCLISSRL